MADSSNVRIPRGGGGSSPSFLSTKVAGIPLWLVLAVVVVAVIVYEKKKSSATTTTTKPSATSNQAGANAANQGAPGGQGYGTYGPGNALELGLAANAQAPTTNSQWEANAEAILVGEGYPFVQIQSALNQYLSGGVLSSVQQEIVNAAFVAAGPAPSPPTAPPVGSASPPTATAPPTVTTPTPAPPAPVTATASGSGYTTGFGSNVSASGEQYEELQANQPLIPGQVYYVQDVPGQFIPTAPYFAGANSSGQDWATAGGYASGTPLYSQLSAGALSTSTPAPSVA